MKATVCKRCDAKGYFWSQNASGKWQLKDEQGQLHHCDDKIKAVKCKYCNSADLHWAEEIHTQAQEKKMVLTESYGLPHACDERIGFIIKENQDKKNKYEAEKTRIIAHPDGKCEPCNGTGNNLAGASSYSHGLCISCHGQANFTKHTRKAMLANERRNIWPNMKENYRYGRR